MSDPRSDEELVRIALRGIDAPEGRAAATELLRRYQRPVLQWCRRYVRDPDRALDLAQDVLAKVWTSLPTFGFRSKFSWWVFVITRNRCLNAKKQPSLLHAHDELPLDLPSDRPRPDEDLERRLDEETVRRLMEEHLDVEERTALWLSYFERMPVDVITETLGLTTSSGARGLLQRARRKLRAALGVGSTEEDGT